MFQHSHYNTIQCRWFSTLLFFNIQITSSLSTSLQLNHSISFHFHYFYYFQSLSFRFHSKVVQNNLSVYLQTNPLDSTFPPFIFLADLQVISLSNFLYPLPKAFNHCTKWYTAFCICLFFRLSNCPLNTPSFNSSMELMEHPYSNCFCLYFAFFS